LIMALESGLGHIVVDNFHELKLLEEIARERGKVVDILLRISPGVDPHTHRYVITGSIDSKFGIPMVYADEAMKTAMAMPEVNVLGLHFHIGSQIDDAESYQKSIDYFMDLAAEFKRKYDFEMKELSIGGGFAIQYTLDSPVPSIATWAELLTSSIVSKCHEKNLPLPKLIIEPGRSMVGQAGVALYTVGVIKDIPDVRCYVSVDGGMADNIRPSLYGAKLEAVAANKIREKYNGEVTIAGKFCESGDILIRDITMPALSAGDIIAIPGCGAYSIPESMNYNASFKPAIVMVRDGKAHLIRRRETLEDLTRCDVL
jgi:diaminopimelate decarboxylase